MDAQLHVVSGKGGVGKTTVAAALALALAAGGRRVLLAEVEGRQGLAQVFDVPPLPYAEVRLAPAADGGEVFGLAIDPEQALYEYLELFYRLGPATKVLRRLGAVEFATTVAPGLRDVLLTGKVYEAVGLRREGRREYDAVVVDGPPTGRIARFLGVGAEVSGLAKVGPIRAQADAISGLITSSRTQVHLVTLLEEMPVQETADGIVELRDAGIGMGRIIVNAVRSPAFVADEVELLRTEGADLRQTVGAELKRLGLPRPLTTADALLREAADHLTRVGADDDQLQRVLDLDPDPVVLPFMDDGIDLAALLQLAEPLRTIAPPP